MPTRSAQPAGGLMSEGEASSGVIPSYSALDREPTDRLLATSGQGHRTESDSSNRPDGSQTDGGLIALRGPGGFPLLGADAIGSWRGNSNVRVATWAERALSSLMTLRQQTQRRARNLLSQQTVSFRRRTVWPAPRPTPRRVRGGPETGSGERFPLGWAR